MSGCGNALAGRAALVRWTIYPPAGSLRRIHVNVSLVSSRRAGTSRENGCADEDWALMLYRCSASIPTFPGLDAIQHPATVGARCRCSRETESLPCVISYPEADGTTMTPKKREGKGRGVAMETGGWMDDPDWKKSSSLHPRPSLVYEGTRGARWNIQNADLIFYAPVSKLQPMQD